MFFILPKSPQSHPEFIISLLHGGRANNSHSCCILPQSRSELTSQQLFLLHYQLWKTTGYLSLQIQNTTEWYQIKFSQLSSVYINIIFMTLLIMLQNTRGIWQDEGQRFTYQDILGPSSSQNRTNTGKTRWDINLQPQICLPFHNFSSTNHHESFSLFSENRELRTCWTSGHQLTWLSCLLCCICLSLFWKQIFRVETQNRCEREQFTQGMRKVRLTEIFFKLPWRKERKSIKLSFNCSWWPSE